MLLQDHQLDKDIKKALAVVFCVNTAINEGANDKSANDKGVDDKGVDEIVDKNKENKKIINVKEFSDKFSGTNNFFSTPSQQIISEPIGDKENEIDETGKLLEELFEKAYKNNEIVKKIINAKARDL